MLEKKIAIDKIEVLETGQIQVRQATRIIEDGKVISQAFHRHICDPDKTDMSDQDPKVQAIAATVWTSEVIAAWEEAKSE